MSDIEIKKREAMIHVKHLVFLMIAPVVVALIGWAVIVSV